MNILWTCLFKEDNNQQSITSTLCASILLRLGSHSIPFVHNIHRKSSWLLFVLLSIMCLPLYSFFCICTCIDETDGGYTLTLNPLVGQPVQHRPALVAKCGRQERVSLPFVWFPQCLQGSCTGREMVKSR